MRVNEAAETDGSTEIGRPLSVILGNDAAVLNTMLKFYAPSASLVVDCTANRRKMWNGVTHPARRIFVDIDPSVAPDVVADFRSLPFDDASADVLVFDPPHLPSAAASKQSMAQMVADYGLGGAPKGNNVASYFSPFLAEAARVLKRDGIVLAKLKDYVHNHAYQWMLVEFINAARSQPGMTACDLVIKKDPCGGNLKSGRWKNAMHVRNAHCWWIVVRNGKCEPRR